MWLQAGNAFRTPPTRPGHGQRNASNREEGGRAGDRSCHGCCSLQHRRCFCTFRPGCCVCAFRPGRCFCKFRPGRCFCAFQPGRLPCTRRGGRSGGRDGEELVRHRIRCLSGSHALWPCSIWKTKPSCRRGGHWKWLSSSIRTRSCRASAVQGLSLCRVWQEVARQSIPVLPGPSSGDH